MSQIKVSHIGARNGEYNFPFNQKFKNEINVYLYEADEKSIDEIIKVNENKYKTKVINKFIGEDNEKLEFNINSMPHNSSSLETNIDNNYCIYHGNKDITAKEAFDTIEKIKLNSYSLSSLIEEKEIDPIDFLSIDTQGTEINILKGLNNKIDDVLCVATEINFIDLYKNQTNSYDLIKFMRDHGFYLIDFFDSKKGSMTRIPINYRNNGQLIHSDALFFKDPKFFLNSESYNEIEKIEKNVKLIFLSIMHNNLDYAYYCYSLQKKQIRNFFQNNEIDFYYQIFVKKITRLMDLDTKYPNQYLKSEFNSFQKIYRNPISSKKKYLLNIIIFFLKKISFTINLYKYLFFRNEIKALCKLLNQYSFYKLSNSLKVKHRKMSLNQPRTYNIFGKKINS